MTGRTNFTTIDVRQIIGRIDPKNSARHTKTYEWSNGRKFFKNELPSAGLSPPTPPTPPTPGEEENFITSSGNTFITSNNKTLKVQTP